MEDFKQRITDLAELMDKFRLSEAEYESDDQRIVLRRKSSAPVTAQYVMAAGSSMESAPAQVEAETSHEAAEPAKPAGTPISSPMTGIFYTASSPNAAPFVKEGDTVTAGQVVGLIEAMKVFNEITSTASGKVLQVVAESGQLVQPGDPLLYIG